MKKSFLQIGTVIVGLSAAAGTLLLMQPVKGSSSTAQLKNRKNLKTVTIVTAVACAAGIVLMYKK